MIDDESLTFLKAYAMMMMNNIDDGLTTDHKENTDNQYRLTSLNGEYQFICERNGHCSIIVWDMDEYGNRLENITYNEDNAQVLFVRDFPKLYDLMTAVYQRCNGYFDSEEWQ